ncbi:MAG: hypothetical protein J6Z01_09785 [Bacteroidales bacterium]|nr:hypothetical protein [Bacteroidales bacterium]
MAHRLLILLLILISTSCGDDRQDVVVNYVDNGFIKSWLNNTDNDNNLKDNYSWYAIVTDSGQVLRTVSRQRTSQRTFEKRKPLWNTSLRIQTTQITFLYINRERIAYSQNAKSGRSLLNFLCKLTC